MQGRSLARSALWILTRYLHNRMDVLTFDPEDGTGLFLALFSFKEEAELFLGLLEEDDQKKHCWRSRETSAGELLSILYGPCKDVRWVALDPLPLSSCSRSMLHFVSVNRKRFVQALMREREDLATEFALA